MVGYIVDNFDILHAIRGLSDVKKCLIFLRYCRRRVNQEMLVFWVCKNQSFSFNKIFRFSNDFQLIGNIRSPLDKLILFVASVASHSRI